MNTTAELETGVQALLNEQTYEVMCRASLIAMRAVSGVLGDDLAPLAEAMFKQGLRGEPYDDGSALACIARCYATISHELAWIAQAATEDRDELRKQVPVALGSF